MTQKEINSSSSVAELSRADEVARKSFFSAPFGCERWQRCNPFQPFRKGHRFVNYRRKYNRHKNKTLFLIVIVGWSCQFMTTYQLCTRFTHPSKYQGREVEGGILLAAWRNRRTLELFFVFVGSF